MKQTCLRSLSVEISAPLVVESPFSAATEASGSGINQKIARDLANDMDKDGAVLYGDQENGYTLSHTFK